MRPLRSHFVLTLFAALFFSAPAPAQSRYLWSDTVDGPAHQADRAADLALGAHGEVFVAGFSRNATDYDALIRSYDPYGHLLWERRIDLGHDESAYGLTFDAAAGALYVLSSNSSGAGSANTVILLRLDPQTGATVWQQSYDGPQHQGAFLSAPVLDGNGGLVTVGYIGTGFVHDFVVVRFDATGTPTWSWSAPTPGSSTGYATSIVVAPNGELVVHVVESLPSAGSQHTFHKLSAAGVPIWSNVVGATDGGCSGPCLDSAGNLLYSINVSTFGGHRIAKLDPAGNSLWSVDAQTFFGVNSSTYGLAVDVQGDILVSGSSSAIVRLDPNGNLLWSASVPASQWFDQGFYAGFVLAPNGDVVSRLAGHTPLDFLDYDVITRFDTAGHLLWSQAIRSLSPGTEVKTGALKLAPQGSVLVAGYSYPAGATDNTDFFVAAVHPQSHPTCFGDGSLAPCPCGNNVAVGTPSGCQRGGAPFGAKLDDQGIASLGSDSLRFYGQGFFSGGIALLLQGQFNATPSALQDGLLCVSGTRLRLFTGTTVNPYLDLPPSGGARISARSATLGDAIQPGSSRAYQVYYRGGASMCAAGNGNLSNAIVVDWAQ